MAYRLRAAVVALLLCLTSVSAFAQSPEEIERAQQHFARGAEKFAAGEYAKAVAEFMGGHAIAPNAMFLYNVSLCYERLGNLEDALAAGERARQFEGMPPEVAVRNEARTHALLVILDSREMGKRIAATTPIVDDEPEGPAVVQTTTRSDGVTALGWGGVALAAVGTGLILGGVATNSSIVKDISDYEAAAAIGDTITYERLATDIDKKQTTGKILYGVGFGAAGLGVALFVVDLLFGSEEVPVATLTPVRGGAMVNAAVRF